MKLKIFCSLNPNGFPLILENYPQVLQAIISNAGLGETQSLRLLRQCIFLDLDRLNLQF